MADSVLAFTAFPYGDAEFYQVKGGADPGFPSDGVTERLDRVYRFAGWTSADTIIAWGKFRADYKGVLPNHYLAVALEALVYIWFTGIIYDAAWEKKQS